MIKRAMKAIRGDFREFRHAVKNPNTYVVPGGGNWKDKTPAEKAAALAKQKEVRGESVQVDEIFGFGGPRKSTMSDYPLVHAYATGYNHPEFAKFGDVMTPQRKHLVSVGRKSIPSNGHHHIANFEATLKMNGHDVESAHTLGACHSFDFNNNPTKHDEVLVNSATHITGKRNPQNSQQVRHAQYGIAAVRAIFRKPDKPKDVY